jgi:hypothetical protein
VRRFKYIKKVNYEEVFYVKRVKFGHLMIEDERRILYTDDDFLLCTMDSQQVLVILLIPTNGNEKDYFELSESKKNKC